MSLSRKRTLFLCTCVALAPILSIVPQVIAAPSGTDQPGEAISYAKSWAEGIDRAHHGHFEAAATILRKIAERSGDVERAQAWVNQWMEEERQRHALETGDYEDYVGRAKKWHGKQDLNKALRWTYLALLNNEDDDSFRRLDWVQAIKRDALAEGRKLYDEKEWREAHSLYYALSLIFEEDEQIDELREHCLEHARLDEIYKEDRDWREPLEGIVPSMVEEALWRIDQKHVVEADFRKMTIAGFEELLLIADSPTLRAHFDGLTGERGADFTTRIQRRLEQVKEQKELTYREALQHFRRALKINRQTAQIPEAVLVREYTNAALGELDEFSSMIWPHDFREFEKHTRGDFIGVGIQIRNKYNPELKDTEILVVSPLEDTPAYRAGIQAEDVITAVNGESLLGVPVSKAVSKITGPAGTTVELTIRRTLENGEETLLEFPLERSRINIQSVKSLKRNPIDEQQWDFILDPDMGIAYVRVNSFQENTVEQLKAALAEASSQGMRGLILDLRYNPGGLLKSAVEMSELFLPRGRRIVSTKGLRSEEWAVDVSRPAPFPDIPLIVLINDSSASASEIVSGAIKDHDRGLVIGERSFGKFSVQNLIPLVHSEAHLKLTTARYYLPSGQSLHHDKGAATWGVEPDIRVPVAPKEQNKIIFMRRDADVIGAVKTSSEAELDEPLKPSDDDGKDGEDSEKEEEELPDPNEYPDRDPQLQTALLVMRMHLLSENTLQMAGSTSHPQERSDITEK